MAVIVLQDDDLSKTLNELKSTKGIKEEYTEIMPCLNFEEYLATAPMSICMIGELMLISSKTDFDLSKNPPEGGFKRLQYPKSFRACLVQVANEGYEAFNRAHTNMDKIRLQTLQTPSQLKSALETLSEGSSEDIRDILPIELRAMKKSVEDCANYAKEPENSFRKVLEVTGELLECCVSTEIHHENKLRKTEEKLKSKEKEIEDIKSRVEYFEKIQREIKTDVEKAEEDYRQTLDKFLRVWDFTGMQHPIRGTVLDVLEKFDSKSENKQGKESTKTDRKDEQGKQVCEPDDEVITLQQFTPKIQLQIKYLTSLVNKEEKKFKTSQFNDETKKEIAYHEEEFKAHRKNLSTYNKDTTRKLCSLYDGCAKICSELSVHVGSLNLDDELMKDLADRITDPDARVMSVASELNDQMKSAPLQHPYTLLKKTQYQAKATGEKSTEELANKNDQRKLTQTSKTMENTHQSYNQACNRAKDSRKHLREFLAETETLHMKKVNFEETKDILRKGISHFHEIRNQWSKMVTFFQMTRNIIDVALHNSTQKFTERVEESQRRFKNLAGCTITDFNRDRLWQQTSQAAKVAYLLNMVSTSYVQVSQDHIMTYIAGLGQLICYRLPDDEDKIKLKMDYLTQDFDKVQGIIIKKVKQSKDEFDQTIEDKMKKLTKAFPTTSDMKRIQKATKQDIVQTQETLVVPALPLN